MASFRGRLWFCSNFSECANGVMLDGVRYPTAEHAYQVLKCLETLDAARVLKCRTPAEAKRIGRHAIPRPDWNEVRVEEMRRVLRAKFQQNPDLAHKLLATENELLVEINEWHDTFWGTCSGVGQNLLGRLLMDVRTEIRQQSSSQPVNISL